MHQLDSALLHLAVRLAPYTAENAKTVLRASTRLFSYTFDRRHAPARFRVATSRSTAGAVYGRKCKNSLACKHAPVLLHLRQTPCTSSIPRCYISLYGWRRIRPKMQKQSCVQARACSLTPSTDAMHQLDSALLHLALRLAPYTAENAKTVLRASTRLFLHFRPVHGL